MEFWDKLTSAGILARDIWQWEGSTFRQRTYGEVVKDAQHVAAGLQRRGVGPGSIVATVITNGPDAIACAIGAWFAGARVASLPIIARGMSIPSYAAQVRRLCARLNSECLVAEDRFLALMPQGTTIGVDVLGCRGLIETSATGHLMPPSGEETMFIQFSSGTTGEPRGVELTRDAIDKHLSMLSQHAAIDPERDFGYSWLPMSHDMGLFGCALLGWYNGIPGVIAPPERFLGAPRTWFDDCADFGATVTAAPPFALGIAARAALAHPSGKLLRLRLCLVGAEQIMWKTLINAADALAPRGLSSEIFTPAYGLAEATLAVTIENLHAAPSFIDVEDAALADGRVLIVDSEDPGARRLVCVGSALPGIDVSIDPTNSEILVRSPSLASGYFGDARLTSERFHNNELRTGDLGFLHEDRLFISGRSDDLLIVAGRNIYVQELERVAGTDTDVRTGNCAIVDIHNGMRPRVTLVAEVNAGKVNMAALAARLYRTTMERGGLQIHEFVFLGPGEFPKTPSGKAQRYRCREIIADPMIGARITLGTSAI